MTAEARNYDRDVTRRLEEITRAKVRVIGEARHSHRSYPLYSASVGTGSLSVLVTGGVHGDEPAGVFAALEWLEQGPISEQLTVVVLPCVNPSGFELGTLESASGININRSFGTASDVPEVLAIEQWLESDKPSFRATFDLHEVAPQYIGEGWSEKDNPTGTYLYETISGSHDAIGRSMIESLPAGAEVCDWPEIYGDRNDRGVIRYPEACGNSVYAEGTTLDGYLNGRFTAHSFTTETPTSWPLAQRIGVQRSYLQTALEQLTR